jgi:maleate isomerase
MRMKKVTKEELAAMDADSDRCAAELSDARMDVLGYACLVAIMSMGKGYHCQSETAAARGDDSRGRACAGGDERRRTRARLRTLQAKKIAMVAPYVQSLCTMVAEYIEHEGFAVVDRVALGDPGQRGGRPPAIDGARPNLPTPRSDGVDCAVSLIVLCRCPSLARSRRRAGKCVAAGASLRLPWHDVSDAA